MFHVVSQSRMVPYLILVIGRTLLPALFTLFHGYAWGGWIFEIASSNSANNTIMFARGGFQEARGWQMQVDHFIISNIFEELDSPNEWFLDKNTRTLYFMPNDTMPKVFVASQIPCLISISGSSIENSAHNITIQGLTLTQTSHTYMRGLYGTKWW